MQHCSQESQQTVSSSLQPTYPLLDPTSSGMHRAGYQRDHFIRVANDKVNKKENESIYVKYDILKRLRNVFLGGCAYVVHKQSNQ
jgi:hypothetical protein